MEIRIVDWTKNLPKHYKKDRILIPPTRIHHRLLPRRPTQHKLPARHPQLPLRATPHLQALSLKLLPKPIIQTQPQPHPQGQPHRLRPNPHKPAQAALLPRPPIPEMAGPSNPAHLQPLPTKNPHPGHPITREQSGCRGDPSAWQAGLCQSDSAGGSRL
jgi:hypothetical protein